MPAVSPEDDINQSNLNWLYLDMNSYFASVEQQDDVRLRNRPLIVVPVKSDYTSAIAASYEAKALGIKTGTSVKEARALCPAIQIREARPDRYVQVHNRILEEVDRTLPIEKVCSIDEVACRLTMGQRHEAAARALGYRIQQNIMANLGECLRSSIGIAPSRMLAKTAADIVKPLGLTVLRQDDLPGKLLDLKLNDLPGVGASMNLRLNKAGVFTVAELYQLPAPRLRQIWGGIGGDNFWYSLHGIDPAETDTIRGSISHSHVLASDLRPIEAARGVARRLVAKCGSRLRRMGYKCGGLHLSIRADRGDGRAQAEAHFDVTADSFRMIEVMDGLWRHCASKLNSPRVKKVSITCTRVIPADLPPDLFGWTPEVAEDARHMRVLKALDGLNQKFGKDAVTIGPRTKVHGFVGAKVAFNRIPENAEFWE
ncbi:Y-family DNA polymerase [Asticcacaulis machinosus]|uniref:DNA-directed DNA polymerase n=1 Tax=Asticcacaulis machinosus TaxID=2984211 RepID=A0ABT5HKJ0_9CAUL|nr:DNA-directed DNA polymerase [Asticcacaulis machinosus]MDC7676645.1 DNA-directed DNA polymerase [Asticcacaulis machinosus]